MPRTPVECVLLELPSDLLRRVLAALPCIEDRLALRAACGGLARLRGVFADVFANVWRDEVRTAFGRRRKPAALTWRQHYFALRARRCAACRCAIDMVSGRVVTTPVEDDADATIVTCSRCGRLVHEADVNDPEVRARLWRVGGRYRLASQVEALTSAARETRRMWQLMPALTAEFGADGPVPAAHPLLMDYVQGTSGSGHWDCCPARARDAVHRVAQDHWLACYTGYGGEAAAINATTAAFDDDFGARLAAAEIAAVAAAGGWPPGGRWPWLVGSEPTAAEVGAMADRVLAPYVAHRLLGHFWTRWTTTSDFGWLPHAEWFARIVAAARAALPGAARPRFRLSCARTPQVTILGLIAGAAEAGGVRTSVTRRSVWFQPA
jgi:hypothetical protein